MSKLHPDYSVHDPRGWCGDPTRGAAMGRRCYHVENPEEYAGRIYVARVPLDAGGYDPNGTYFGSPDWGQLHRAGSTDLGPLYWAHDADCEVDFVFRVPIGVWDERADWRRKAVAHVRAIYPKARVR
jgi:hypothetical protein